MKVIMIDYVKAERNMAIIACHSLANSLTRSALVLERNAVLLDNEGLHNTAITTRDLAEHKRFYARDARRRAFELAGLSGPANTESAASLS